MAQGRLARPHFSQASCLKSKSVALAPAPALALSRMKQIQFARFGGPEVLEMVSTELVAPAAGEISVRHIAVGVNFIDVLLRRGDLGGVLPARIGLEGAGNVTAVGSGVEGIAVGDRVVYAGGPAGSYSDMRNVDASRAVVLPPGIGEAEAAALFFKALTADYLIHRLRDLKPGDTVLFHGATGGVGSIAVPWLTHKGINVVGTTGQRAKAAYAAALGCQRVAVLGEDDIVQAVSQVSRGRGATVVYDPIGQSTFEASFASLARFGLLVSYGWASGDIDPISATRLRERGSVFITRPTVSHYIEDRTDLLRAAARVFDAYDNGIFRAQIFERFPLSRAAEAHALLERGGHQGSLILQPF